MAEFLTWSDIRVGTWNSNPYTWNDVSLIEELIVASAGNPYAASLYAQDFTPIKKQQLIRVILKLQGKEYIESKYKNQKNIKIKASDIKLVFDNLTKIKTSINEVSIK